MTTNSAAIIANVNKIVNLKKLRSLTTLEADEKYKILSLEIKNTKFGARMLVEFQDFNCFLGERFNKISSEDLNHLKQMATMGKLYITSKGAQDKMVEVEFIVEN